MLGASTVIHVQRDGTFNDIRVNDNIVVQGEKIGDADYNARLITDQGP